MVWKVAGVLAGLAVLAQTASAQTGSAQTAAPRAVADTPPGSPGPDQPLKCPLDAPYDPGNPFALILAGKASQSVVAQTRLMIAIVPTAWTQTGHVLVIPRRAVRNLDGLSDAEMLDAMHLIRRLAAAQRKAYGATGYSVLQNNGRIQTVCHMHFHVLPNTPVLRVENASPAQMDEVAARLRAALPAR
jgi:histidine triad (HIT) family protein